MGRMGLLGRMAASIVLISGAIGCLLVPTRAAVETRTVKLNGQTFTLPAGFEIELVAGPPLVSRPITADFDEQGRLYVSDSSGSSEPVQTQLQKKPHRIVRLEDTDGDGRFDKSVVFADKMMFPEGALWHAGSLFVAAPPSIWKLTDTDGDGVADQRVEWFQGKTLTGCANDLHGPYLGPDGWIYWCKGAFAQQTYERPGSKPFVTRASHIFRARPDGSGIEPVMTGGMDNPVHVVFTPGGERIFTTTFLVHPGGGQRDGLIHAIYGGVCGKDHAVIHDPVHKRTGPDLMPVLAHLGAAVPAGLVRCESDAFGPAYRDNLFTALFNLHKVSRHVLTPQGASFSSRDEDFVVSDSLDFHPTHVLEDADGSLLIIDTGGWYKLCCPSSQLQKPDITGAIYRVRKTGAPKIGDPRGLKLKWDALSAEELAGLLGDPRPVVRRRAMRLLGEKGTSAVLALAEAVRTGKTEESRRNAVWAATRIDRAEARAAVRQALADSSETVRQTAIHSVSLWRDREALSGLRKLLLEGSVHNQRAAAEALGRLGDRAAVPDLIEALNRVKTPDRALEHSLTFALIEIGDGRIADNARPSNPNVNRAVLTALDQMEGSKLDARRVAKELTAADARLKETAWWIASRHPEWGEALAGFFREQLAVKNATPAAREELIGRLARFAQARPVQEMLAERLREDGPLVLRAMAQANLKETPESWMAGLTRVLASEDAELLRDVVAALRVLRIPKAHNAAITAELLRIASSEKRQPALRVAALDAVPGGLTEVTAAHFKLLLAQLGQDEPVAVRSLATNVLARAKLGKEQLLALAESLKMAGPMEVNRLLEAFVRSSDEQVGKVLLAILKDSAARGSLRVDVLKQYLAKYPASVQKQAEELYALLDVDAVKQRARLEQLLTAMTDGDIRRGQRVFHSSKAACAACHAIGYLGGKAGPDLTHIARIRSERDLLEAIVYPSANLVRSYEPILVITSGGKMHNGLLRTESPDELLLVTGANQEVRIARKDIEDIRPSKVSVMPSGLDQQLTPQELADLVAFLKACK